MRLRPWLNPPSPSIPQSSLDRGIDEIKAVAAVWFEDVLSSRKALIGDKKSDVELFCAVDVEVMKTEGGVLELFARDVVSGVGFLLLPELNGLDRMMSQLLLSVPDFLAQ